jgi:CelD/BcsL family acetyltransferase involved in cellulose biosynthesis
VAGARLYHVEERRRLGPLGYRVARGATNLQTAYFDVTGAADPAALAGAGDELIDATGADMFEFDYVAGNAALFAAAQAWVADGRASIEMKGRTAISECSGSFDEWMEGRNKSDRRTWRRNARRLQEIGAAYEVITDIGDTDVHADEVIDIEGSGWKGQEQSAIKNNPRDMRFYTLVTRRSAAEGCLHLAMMRHQGRAVAFDYGILSGGSLLALKASYREEYKGFSIGHIAAVKHLADAFAMDDVTLYDMLGNGMTPHAHKVRFATGYRPFHRIRLFARTLRGELLLQADRAERVARAVRRSYRVSAVYEPVI